MCVKKLPCLVTSVSNYALINKLHITITFIAIPNGEEIYVIGVAVEEKQRNPAVAAVYGHDEQDAYDPSLLRGVRVPAQVLVYLQITTLMSIDAIIEMLPPSVRTEVP